MPAAPATTWTRPAPLLLRGILGLGWVACVFGPWLLLSLATARWSAFQGIERIATAATPPTPRQVQESRWVQLGDLFGADFYAWGWVGPFASHAFVASALALILVLVGLSLAWRRLRAERSQRPWIVSPLWPVLGVVPWALLLAFLLLPYRPGFPSEVARLANEWFPGWPLGGVYVQVIGSGVFLLCVLGPVGLLLGFRRFLARRYGTCVVADQAVTIVPVDFLPYRLVVAKEGLGARRVLPAGVLVQAAGARLLLPVEASRRDELFQALDAYTPGAVASSGRGSLLLTRLGLLLGVAIPLAVALARLGAAWLFPTLVVLLCLLVPAYLLMARRTRTRSAIAKALGLFVLSLAFASSTPPVSARVSIVDQLGNRFTVVSRPGEPTWFVVVGEPPEPFPLPGAGVPWGTRLLVVPPGEGGFERMELGTSVPRDLGQAVWGASLFEHRQPIVTDSPCDDLAWSRFRQGATSRAYLRIFDSRGDALAYLVEEGRVLGVFLHRQPTWSTLPIRWEQGEFRRSLQFEDLEGVPADPVPFAPYALFDLRTRWPTRPIAICFPGELPDLEALQRISERVRAQGESLEEAAGGLLPFWQLDLTPAKRDRARRLAAEWRAYAVERGPAPFVPPPHDAKLSQGELETFELSVAGLGELAQFGPSPTVRQEALAALDRLGWSSRYYRAIASHGGSDRITPLALEALAGATRDRDPKVREASLSVLAEWSFLRERTEAVLWERLLEDSHAEVRLAAAKALYVDQSTLFWPARSAPALLRAARDDSSPAVREAAFKSLRGAAGSVAPVSSVSPFLRSEDPAIRLAAADVIIRTGGHHLSGAPEKVLGIADEILDAGLTPGGPPLPADLVALLEERLEPQVLVASLSQKLRGKPSTKGTGLLARSLLRLDSGQLRAQLTPLLLKEHGPALLSVWAKLGAAARPAIPTLLDLLGAEQPAKVRSAALSALARIVTPKDTDTCRAPLERALARAQKAEAAEVRSVLRRLEGCRCATPSALCWLKRNQKPDGRWVSPGGRRDLAVTSLCALAYFGEGHTHRFGTYKRSVNRALTWLKRRQRPDGRFGEDALDQAFCTMAIAEAYAVSRDVTLKRYVQKARDALLTLQGADGGWAAKEGSSESSTFVTGWAVMALKASKTAGVSVPEARFARARAYLTGRTDSTGRVGPGSDCPLGPDSNREGTPTSTAIAVICRIFTGEKRSATRDSARLLQLPTPERPVVTYWYFGTYSMFQVGGAGWKRWLKAGRQTLRSTQQAFEEDEFGSWNPTGPWGDLGGRAGTTALNRLTLAIGDRYERAQRH